jgi:hypothetical protein
VNRQIYDEFMSTGAIVARSGSFEPAGGWGGDHHDGVPIYVDLMLDEWEANRRRWWVS